MMAFNRNALAVCLPLILFSGISSVTSNYCSLGYCVTGMGSGSGATLTCTCPADRTGWCCEYRVCNSSCQNGGVTFSGSGGKIGCTCTSTNWAGNCCELPTCTSSTYGDCAASHGGGSTDSTWSPKVVCNCNNGRTGNCCEYHTCYMGACQNGGTPSIGIKDGMLRCGCPIGWAGACCQLPTCTTCLAGGTPDYNTWGGGPNTTCTCSCDTTGNCCQYPVCATTCQNGGTAVYGMYGRLGCLCSANWVGSCCESAVCTGGWCNNQGTAVLVSGSKWICACNAGRTGTCCESQTTCSTSCQNSGTMSSGHCTCSPSYTGNCCEKPVCSPSCQNMGNCTSPGVCTCQTGWSGAQCQTIASCNYPACQNGGTFVASAGQCSCPSGFPNCSAAVITSTSTSTSTTTTTTKPSSTSTTTTTTKPSSTSTSTTTTSTTTTTTTTTTAASVPDVTAIQTLLNALSSTFAYWPLTADFSTRDATTRHLDGAILGGAPLAPVIGPTGVANKALKTGPNAFVTFTDAWLDDDATPWTVAAFVNTGTGIVPLFEYYRVSTPLACAHLFQYNNTDLIAYGGPDRPDIPALPASCKMNNVWQFVAFEYDRTAKLVKVFCNETFVSTTPVATDPGRIAVLYMGRSESLIKTADAKFACASVYKTALNVTDLLKVKQLCGLYQGITCSPNCAPGSCRVNLATASGYNCTCIAGFTGNTCNISFCTTPCQNGGSCTGPNTCTCTTGWGSLNCSTVIPIIQGQIQSILTALPPLLAYWPLDGEFQANEATSTHLDGVATAPLATGVGPFGRGNGALRTTAGPPDAYLNFNSTLLLNLGLSSFTMTAFINIASLGPIFEFAFVPPWGVHFRQDTFNLLYLYDGVIRSTNLPCSLTNGWQFVGFGYDNSTNRTSTFCNETYGATGQVMPSHPNTYNLLHFGHRSQKIPGTTESLFACASIFGVYLTASQLLQVKKLCPLYQGISCSINCQPGSCRPSLTAPAGYTCTCKPGWPGPTCEAAASGPDVAAIQALLNDLSSTFAYWPLTADFSTRDATTRHLDGAILGGAPLTPVVGPTGVANKALKTGPNAFVTFTDPWLNDDAAPWTVAAFVNTGTGIVPLFEYYRMSSSYACAHLFQYNQTDMIAYGDLKRSDVPALPCSCKMNNVWQFVAFEFDSTAKLVKVFCNDTFVSTTPVATDTCRIEVLYMGRSEYLGITADAKFACASVYSAALSVADLLKVKQLCGLYQAINCSPNCAPDTCRVDLTAASGYKCTCISTFTGSTCNIPVSIAIQNAANTFSMVTYWPLTRDFGGRDATTNRIDGVAIATPNSEIGPFGLANTALRLASAQNTYLTFTSSKLNFATSCWTLSTYVQTGSVETTMFDFVYSGGGEGVWLAQWKPGGGPYDNQLNGCPHGDTVSITMACPMSNVWQFVAMSYDNTTKLFKIFCNDSYYATTMTLATPPYTGSILYMSNWPGEVNNASFACASSSSKALSAAELVQVKQLCPFFQGITCSQHCTMGTCRVDAGQAAGYSCTCSSGWTGATCDTALCTSPCQNGGSCTAPDVCTCMTGWGLINCSTAIPIIQGQIQTILNALPPILAYWPLNGEFQANDATSTHLDGAATVPLATGMGPFGRGNGALRVTAGPPDAYLNFVSTLLNFGSSSWTMTAFVNMAVVGPIFEFAVGTNSGTHLWQYATTNTITCNTGMDVGTSMPCQMTNGWQFVGFAYNNLTRTMNVLCNETYATPTTALANPPNYYNLLYFGHRELSSAQTIEGLFACGSIFSAYLTTAELLKVKQLCPLYQGISCSVNCRSGTCRPSLTAPAGYTCTCKPDWTGPTCEAGVLPSIMSYWPLTRDFEARDATSTHLDGIVSPTLPTTAVGPFGIQDTAMQFINGSPYRYILFNSSLLHFGARSWTLSLWVKTTPGTHPLFDYYFPSSSTAGAHMWQYNNTDYLESDPKVSSSVWYPCPMNGVWQFVAMTYDHPNLQLKLFCNNTLIGANAIAAGSPPITNSVLFMGHRYNSQSATANFACASAFSDTISQASLLQVKELCQLYEQITCSPYCTPGTCRVDLAVPDGFTCTCLPNWTGPSCLTALQWAPIQGILRNLPSLVSYWPLTRDFYTTDTTSTHLDGVASTALSSATGPFGNANGALQLTNTAPLGYVTFQSSLLNFGASSWTLSLFVNAATLGPFYDYVVGALYGTHLWQIGGANQLFGNPGSTGSGSSSPCSLSNVWQFVAFAWDSSTMTMKLFCNNTYVVSTPVQTSPANTFDILHIGHRSLRVSRNTAGLFACGSAFSSFLSESQLQQVKQLCSYYQAISCPTNYATGSCRVDITSTTGYTCNCTVTCTPPCQTGTGNCTAPNTCTCLSGWTSSTCAIPICTSPCQNGAVCTAPDTCTCISGWTGPICADAICSPECQNGGSCTAPGVCTCPVGLAPPDCTIDLLTAIRNTTGTITSMVTYWPLTRDFDARDSTINQVDGVPNNTLIWAIGPFGVPNTGLQVTDSTTPHTYVTFTSPLLDFNASSWTISTYVNTDAGGMPLFDYRFFDAGYGINLWQSPTDTLYVNPTTTGDGQRQVACTMNGVWQFVAIVYDHPNHSVKLFCNSTFALDQFNLTTFPKTTSNLPLGHKQAIYPYRTANAKFACASSFGSALGVNELLQVKQLCRLYQAITCSPNCLGGTCRVDLSQAALYTCTCQSGWSGSICSIAICSFSCQNGGNCTSPEMCRCAPGFAPPDCSIAIKPAIQAALTSLTSIVTYWPLTRDFQARDATTNRVDGTVTYPATSVVGPFGIPDTALGITPKTTPHTYITFNSSLLNYGASSWTVAAYVNFVDSVDGPLFEFFLPTYATHFWRIGRNTLFSNPALVSLAGPTIFMPCSLDDVWQFVAMSYDSSNNIYKIFCNNTFSATVTTNTTVFPVTSNILNMGHREQWAQTTKVNVACASSFGSALSEAQLLQVKQLCALYQAITCSPNCVTDTCRVSVNETLCYTCSQCNPMWTGSTCTTPLCVPTCENGGTCNDQHACVCASGWTGATCATPICTSPCQHGGTCSSAYTCTCTTGYTGATCETPTCSPTCENGGTCGAVDTCTCVAGWTGVSCENPIVCTPPCENGGTCNNFGTCTCPSTWTGDSCIIPVCLPFCHNGGTCVSPNLCECSTGWTGSTTGCNTAICSSTCQHGGTCTAPDTCTCTGNWAGANCTTPVCTPACQNGGTCIGPNTCSCPNGWLGATCSDAYCSSGCQNGGSCTAANTCTCPNGWTAEICDLPICTSACQNGGTCTAPDKCTCTDAYAGDNCTSVVISNPVCTSPCQNGGVCAANGVCKCTASWKGAPCTTPVCSTVCAHGGTCIAPNMCACPDGWEGLLTGCDTPICEPPCGNGNCNAPKTCTCAEGWGGAICSASTATAPPPIFSECESECKSCMEVSDSAYMYTRLRTGSLCMSIRPDIGPICEAWALQGNCLANAAFMWSACQMSCAKYATCECEVPQKNPFDLNCTCGDWAALGMCETDNDTMSACKFTCGRRLNPIYYCSPYPLGVPLPPSSHWSRTPSGLRCFHGNAAYLQSAVMVCNKGFAAEYPGDTGMHICDPFSPIPSTGNWTLINPRFPNCIQTACDDPPAVSGGYYINSTNGTEYKKGDLVTYFCNKGYEMVGTRLPQARCTFLGETGWSWRDKAPYCILPPCHYLADGINTIVNVSANHTGGVATFSCVKGFQVDANLKFFVKTCQADGSWTPEGQPQCSPVTCGPPPEEDNSYLTGTKPWGIYNFGESVTVQCTKGSYSLYIEPGTEATPLGFVINTCLDTGFWSTNTLSCLLVQCPYPEPFEISDYRLMNSSAEVQILLYGGIVAFECDWNQGFEPAANQTSRYAYWECNENSTWDKQPLACSPNALLQVPKLKQVVFESDSAVATASTVLGILGFFLGVIVCLDYMTLPRDLRRLKHNWRHFTRRLRDARRAKELHDIRQKIRNQYAREEHLKQIQAEKERRQLAEAGITGEHSGAMLVPNPLLNNSARPLSADRTARRPDHVDGEMDVPENPGASDQSEGL